MQANGAGSLRPSPTIEKSTRTLRKLFSDSTRQRCIGLRFEIAAQGRRGRLPFVLPCKNRAQQVIRMRIPACPLARLQCPNGLFRRFHLTLVEPSHG